MALGFAYLSGEHPVLPFEELRGCLEAEGVRFRELLRLDQVILLDVDDLDGLARAVGRSSFVKEGGELLAVADLGDDKDVRAGLKKLGSRGLTSVQVRVERVRGSLTPAEAIGMQRSLVKLTAESGIKIDQLSGNLVKAYVTEGAVVLGLVIAKRDLGDTRARSPPNKPFWRSGELDLLLSRAFVNMSRLRKGGLFLDPFCGTGTIAIEAYILGASRSVCFDIDPEMVSGAHTNSRRLGVQLAIVQENSEFMPLPGNSVDSIATDPPYGRSTRAPGGYEAIVRAFLREARRVLRTGSYIVYAGPAEERPFRLAEEEGLEVIERLDQLVHSTLTRQIVVAKKTA
ncbi:MAG: methyltransferase domain-containing protein [Acidilobus sp.]